MRMLSGPLILTIETAPVPGMVAGAQIVSFTSKYIYSLRNLKIT